MLRRGEPKDTVCQVADEIDADLLVMGSRGIKGLEAILGNSVSQYVFQLTNRPMLLVKDDIDEIQRYIWKHPEHDSLGKLIQATEGQFNPNHLKLVWTQKLLDTNH
jgi:hypothetical protein